MTYLTQIALNDGKTWTLDAPSPQALELGRAILAPALATGRGSLPPPLPPGYELDALAARGILTGTIHGPIAPDLRFLAGGRERMPLVSLAVARKRRHSRLAWEALAKLAVTLDDAGDVRMGGDAPADPPTAPWLGISIHLGLALSPSAMEWMLAVERAIAWAWLERDGD